MFHSSTPQHSKEVITQSLLDPCGVFASVAMGIRGVNTIIHYGTPSSIEDYFQASGRGSGESACSLIIATGCQLIAPSGRIHQQHTRGKLANDVRKYLDNSLVFRQKWLLQYFDPENAKPGE